MTSLNQLQQFRQEAYGLLGNARDALFDLMDAVLVSRSISSFAELSLTPIFRRRWSSLYEALQDGNPPRVQLMQLYTQQLPQTEPIVLAGDHTAWPRPQAVTLQDRTYEHQAQPLAGAKPVTVGQGYSTLAWIPQVRGSWAVPLLHERITSFENPIDKLITQLRLLEAALGVRFLFLGDAEYGCARFVADSADIGCDKLLRLRSNRVVYGEPSAYSGRGRPRKHGDKFKLNDSKTWWQAEQHLELHDPHQGHLRVRLWNRLHFRTCATVPMSLILVERFDEAGKRRSHPLWLIWLSEQIPDLTQLWQQYLRRFAIDHWYRFCKQRLHWTLPHLASPEQAQRWSDLMPLLSWQLWLAQTVVSDCPLPWQKPATDLSPGRVANSFAQVLAVIGTPAVVPRPRGKSPGWTPGRVRQRRIRCPVVKKGFAKPRNSSKRSA